MSDDVNGSEEPDEVPGDAPLVVLCNICKREVPLENDGYALDNIYKGLPFDKNRLLGEGFHLLPHVENKVEVCHGSPSRRQYVTGRPQDVRPGHVYNADKAEYWRDAYAKLQQLAGQTVV